MKLLFATHNPHKIAEIRQLLPSWVQLVSLADLGDNKEIPETGETLQENALIKARTAFRRHGIPCFADDTGLEVEALNGRPGVYSARYAGEACTPAQNREKLLQELQGEKNRSALFRTVIALVGLPQEHLFQGVVKGEILTHEEGSEGFGYDKLFRPKGYSCTFANMSADQKNSISHRGKATQALLGFLNQLEP